MTSRYIIIGIVVGVFIAGISVGNMITNRSPTMMQNSPVPGPMGWIDPTLPHTWMNNMMSNPDAMKNWADLMLQDPKFMNTFMVNMMKNSNFRQQYMGPWMMTQNRGMMHNMMSTISPTENATIYQHMIINTDKVSIVSGAWQINTTESYHPTIIQITAGTSVKWTNDDSIIHTVTDIGGTFDSDFIQPDSNWKHTFEQKGKYTYFCTIHPWMKGIVIVS
jgi:plastocyanin